MAWSYDPNELDEPLNKVRLLIGDTKEIDPLLDDDEIQAFLDEAGSTASAAVLAARAIAFKFARLADKWVGDLKILASQKHRNYMQLAEDLSGAAAVMAGYPTAGGVYVADKESQAENDGLVAPYITRGMHDFGTL